ncbi:extracellular solute-binding protein, family 5 Middle [Sporobacter termitidis DSM 10068]|uniref:Extracellular solute-binding protein, family 5 Middle n=1 Tax=Sporobacter termitidis DSM 10068 TaxID=1123282 RepID=A0A1M5XAH1_9FIRM|nr:ABC transporter substrate-binding protein [Sporobacter termitidis]SHH96865.1 extracellular solute-binding protein, family 5 Middle [Sporobacter termitidis DSM 10068]
MKRSLAVILALVLVCSLFACAKTPGTDTSPSSSAPGAPVLAATASPSADSDAEGTPQYGGVMKIVCTAEGANPIGVPWLVYGVDLILLVPTCETLFIQSASGDLEPVLAESYKTDIDNKQIVIELRQGVKFTDGSDWNADVAVWNLRNDKKANMVSTAITDIVKLGDYEIALKFDQYSNDIVSSLTTHTNAVISKESYEKNGEAWAKDNPVGTGPFILKKYVQGASIEFTKNPNYWQKDKPYLDGIEYQFIRDAMTQNIAMQADGQQSVDVLETTSGEQIETLRQLGFTIISAPMGTNCLIPSSKDQSSPLSKTEVRQAISYAIDRDSIVAARGFGVWTSGDQMVADAFPAGHLDDSYNCTYDLDKAKELMKQAGYENGFSTTIYAQPGMTDKDTIVAIQSMLSQIGIKAELQFPDSGGYTAIRKDWDGLLVQHVRALPQIGSTFNFFFGKTQTIYPNLWAPDEMETLIQDSMHIQDNAQQLRDMAELTADNMLVIPVYNQMDTWVTKPYVKGGEFTKWDAGTQYQPANAYFAK